LSLLLLFLPAGVRADQLAAAAASIQLRPGCADTLSAAAAAGIPVSLLSVNWSRTLINAAMGFPQQQQQEQQQQQQAQVYANELEFGPEGVSTGQLQTQVQCGRDKLAVLREMLGKHRQTAAATGGFVVYVGDSCSDILPLIEVRRAAAALVCTVRTAPHLV
jgi:2-hydroxy-3-keto-5-methylthiopentenyl-1-phosphate phosphatase